MIVSLTDNAVRQLRVRAQGLGAHAAASGVAEAVRAVVGLQAQDAAAVALGVRARGGADSAAVVEQALVAERSVVRTWAMRGTLHLVDSRDIGWIVALLGPTLLAGMRKRHAELGIDGEVGVLGVRLIRDALAARGPQTRHELAAALAPHGVPTAGQAIVHLIGRAALEGWVCLGPSRGREPSYVLVDDWVGRGPPLARDVALGELARRYLAAHGPSTSEDLASWSGLSRADARAGWHRNAADLREVGTTQGPAWLLADRAGWLDDVASATPVVHLLPAFDAYLLGYRSRAFAVAQTHARQVHPGGGIIHPVVLVDGLVVAVWRIVRRSAGLEVVVSPFEALTTAVLAGVETEAASIGHFYGRPASLQVAPTLS